jgi:succinate-acetate transporter protein
MAQQAQQNLVEKAFMADPAPLGLAGFAFTTFLLSFANAGILPASTAQVVMPLAMAYGGTCQFIAGAYEMRKGNTFGFTAFSSYGAFWWFYALLVLLSSVGIISPPASAIGTALILYGFFTLYMWIPVTTVNLSLNLTFLFLWLAFFILGAGALTGSAAITHIGGYVGFLTAFFAAYTSFAIVTNSVVGAGTIPTGPGLKWKRSA